jgi:hypothetical protein
LHKTHSFVRSFLYVLSLCYGWTVRWAMPLTA